MTTAGIFECFLFCVVVVFTLVTVIPAILLAIYRVKAHRRKRKAQKREEEERLQRCFGNLNERSARCLSCGFRGACAQRSQDYDATSAVVFEPTDSAALETGSTQIAQIEGGTAMKISDFETRKEKAKELEVVLAGDDFLVKSSTRKGGYMVTPDDGSYHCACMDYATHRGDPNWKCKHIMAVEVYLEERGPTSSDSRYEIIDIGD